MARITAKFIDFGTSNPDDQVNARTIPVINVPVHYTPIQEASEGTNKISAHLKGIDAVLNPAVLSDISTTDSTSTLLQTITPDTDQLVYFESKIFAHRTGGTAGLDGDTAVFVRSGKIKNVSGVATLGTVQSNYTNSEQSNWAVQFAVSGTDLLVSVNGADNNNVDWHVATTVFVHNF